MPFDYKKLLEENLYKYGHDTDLLDMLGEKLYSDKAHFIYELLQNAEDAGAKSVLFQLFEDRLEILHDGDKFNNDNAEAITRVAKSTKSDYTQIGKFGIGFKSVYAMTDAPEIHSGGFHFYIEKYIRPIELPIKEIDDEWTTLFVLPFKMENQKQIYERILKRLRELNIRTLLFLNNITSIRYAMNDVYGEYSREELKNEHDLRQVSLVGQGENETFLVFSNEIAPKKVDIAFRYDDKKQTILTAKNTHLFVYFATEKYEDKLGFILNGNFRTTPARDNIPEDDEHNKGLMCMASDLLCEAMQKIKFAKLCNISFLETLPIIKENFREETMFYLLFERVRETLSFNPYLPTVKDGFVSASNAVIARSSELIELYEIDGKTWLSKDITTDKTRELFEYLQKILLVPIIDPDKFAREIDTAFLKKQSDEWFMQFYDFLNGQTTLWREGNHSRQDGVLRSKPILRLEDDTLRTPNEDVFLPTNTPSIFPTLKKVISDNEDSMKFLKALGLEKPKLVDYIVKTIFPKYEENPNVVNKQYKSDLEQILAVRKGDSEDAKKKLNEQLKDLFIIQCTDGQFRKPKDVYCNSELLRKWFQYSENIYFATDTLPIDDWELLGVFDLPRMVHMDNLPNGVVNPNQYSCIAQTTNYDLKGLNDFIANISSDNALIITNIIIREYRRLSNLFTGVQYYRWYGHTYSFQFQNDIFQTLSTCAWILGCDNNLYKPSDIMLENIADSVKNIANLPLQFKTNKELILEEELAKQGKKIVDAADYENDMAELAQLRAEKAAHDNKKQDLDDWESEYSIDEIIISEGIASPIPQYVGIGVTRKFVSHEQSAITLPNIKVKESSPQKIKKIGQLGEDIVKKYLIEFEGFQDTDINILNDAENLGTGRDFEVSKNGRVVKIIEVKTTESTANEHCFTISGKQWETARHEGDIYWIYSVFGVGTKTPQVVTIQNPIKEWKDGYLQADPVHFTIRKKPHA